MRRVVVTGLGAVTPLGVGQSSQITNLFISYRSPIDNDRRLGIRRTWNNLINGRSGIVSTTAWGPSYASIPSQVAGAVPKGTRRDGGWNAEEWVTKEALSNALIVLRIQESNISSGAEKSCPVYSFRPRCLSRGIGGCWLDAGEGRGS